MALIYIFVIFYYFKKESEENFIKFDEATVTAGDYTVELEIPK